MYSQALKKLLITPAAIFGLILTGCLNEQPVSSPEGSVKVSTKSEDPRIQFLVTEAGIQRELISVVYDSITRDTGYILEPPITVEQRRRGMRGTGVGFKAREVDKLIQAKAVSDKRGSSSNKTAAIVPPMAANNLLSKKAQTRWDHWYAPIDVKNIKEVREVRVFINQTGPARLGPNWIAGVRSAIANWNAQAKGTAISFLETSDAVDHDVSFRGSWGIGSDGSLTSSAFLTADQYMRPDGISLWVNTGYESATTPHNQKTTVAMSLLALSTNITFTGMEGYYWSDGASIHIPGTPATDGDGLTAGSSILTYGTSTVSTPVMTAGDLKAFRTIYPTHAITAGSSYNNYLYMAAKRSHQIVDINVKSFQASNDTLYFLRTTGSLFRRVGLLGGTNVQLWPGPGSSGAAAEFLYSKGFLAVRTTTGKMYTRTLTGSWIAQNPSATYASQDFRLDGNRLTVSNSTGSQLHSFYLGGPTASPAVHEFTSAANGISDWAIRNGLLVVVDYGNVWAKQGNEGWNNIQAANAGYVYNIQLSDQLMVMYYHPNGSPHTSFAVRMGGISGWTAYYFDKVDDHHDIDVCDDKVAFLQQSAFLRVIDYTNWTVYEHYTMPTGESFNRVQLTGANCDFVTAIAPYASRLFAKYGIDFDNEYQGYLTSINKLGQTTVPQ